MKILVTGGTGYIGSHTVVELQQMGYKVNIIDNLSNSDVEVVKRIEKITGIKPEFTKLDICDINALKEYFDGNKNIEGVIHFAAFKSVSESVENPLKYYHNNVNGMINLLECLKENSIDKLIFSSSCTVYGVPDNLPVTENENIKPAISPYGHTKQICEDIIKTLSVNSKINSVILRYFNPAGAHESAEIGELPIGVPDNLIPYITQTAVGKRECLKIFGGDYDTYDGTCIRDYIHVVDLAKAHIAALERLIGNNPRPAYEVFNLGTGKGYSVLDVIKSFMKVTNQKINYEFTGRRRGDVDKVWADTTKANQYLNWQTSRNIDDIMKSAWNWELKLKSED